MQVRDTVRSDFFFTCGACGHMGEASVAGVARPRTHQKVARARCPKCETRAFTPLARSAVRSGAILGVSLAIALLAHRMLDGWPALVGWAAFAATLVWAIDDFVSINDATEVEHRAPSVQ